MADRKATRMRATPVPADMAIAPDLPAPIAGRAPRPYFALLVNPFYAKDPRASYGKHRDWEKYDTAHVVFQPKHMSCEELDGGYAWCYDRLFSHASIWRRRPQDARAVLAYLAMSYLYKRSNRFWHLLIKHRLTDAVWQPLIEHSRQRHLKLRSRLELMRTDEGSLRASQCISPGV